MANREQLISAIKRASAAGDYAAANEIASILDATRPEEKKEDPSMLDKVGDFFSGNLRETDQQRDLPELQNSGLLTGESGAHVAAVSPALLTATDPNEIAQIITSNFPNIGVTYNKDNEGNVYPILVNNETGAATIINRPGMSGMDVMQGLGIAAAYAPISKAASVPALMAKAAGMETGIQGVQAASGGEFNPEDVAISAIGTGAGELLGKAGKGIIKKLSKNADEAAEIATEEAISSEAARLGNAVSPESQAARQTDLLSEIAETVAAKPKNQSESLRTLSGNPGIDQARLDSAKALGIEGDLMPSQLGRNSSYIELEQGLASIPGSNLSAQSKESIKKVAQTADDLIEEFGGTTEKSNLSEVLKDKILGSIDDLEDSAGVIYGELNKQIPKSTKIDSSSISDNLLNAAADLGEISDLEGVEKRIFYLANREGGMTYALLDKERKKVGEALRKAKGPYKDESTSSLKRLYGVLSDSQENAIKDIDTNNLGLSEKWDAAKSLVKTRKELEDNSILLLGKDKASAIMPKIGSAMKKISTGDFRDFDVTMKALPPELREEAVVSALNDVFTMGSRKEKQMSIPGFVDWYSGAKRNGTLPKIEKHLPEGASKRLKDIYNVASGVRTASNEKITTGRINAMLKKFDEDGGMISKIYQTGKSAAAAEGLTSAAGAPGVGAASAITSALTKEKTPFSQSADQLLSSPEFKRAAIEYSRYSSASSAKRKAADKLIESSEKYKKWLSLLPSGERAQVMRLGLMSWLSSDQEKTPKPKPKGE